MGFETLDLRDRRQISWQPRPVILLERTLGSSDSTDSPRGREISRTLEYSRLSLSFNTRRSSGMVRENGGFSGYSAEETSGSQQVTPTGAPGTSPTHSHRLVRKSISSGCHIETPTSLTYDQAFELHQKKKNCAGPDDDIYQRQA